MYTYAFLLTPTHPLELPLGIAGDLQCVTIDRLTALVEPDLAFETIQTSDHRLMQAVLDHDRVIRELFQQSEVLPLRFGTQFISLQGLVEHLTAHHDKYVLKLAGFWGKAEYLLKFVPLPAPAIAPEVTSKPYFLAQQAHTNWKQQQHTELQQVITTIAQHYPNWIRSEPDQGIERLYLLSDRQQERSLLEAAKAWQLQCQHWQLSVGEALPLYHFV